MNDAGLDVRIDAVGNIAGRWTLGDGQSGRKAVAAGSHLDSVPNGGIFDGPLGVYAALEGVRAIKESDLSVRRPIDVVCFTGEEGTRFADGVLGSSVAAGKMPVTDALSLSDGDTTLEDALEEIGFRGRGQLDASAWDSWLELHVEQGERLESAGLSVCNVTAITGTTRCHLTIHGKSDHSGTTAMADRADALAAASELVLEIERTAKLISAEKSESAVATVGSLEVEPGAVNVISGRVDLSVDIRDVESGIIEEIVESVKRYLDRIKGRDGFDVTFERPYDIPPRPMTPRIRQTVENAAAAANVETKAFHSGAGHDTMQVADVTDTGMILVRSQGGHSHSPLEWTDWEDCREATHVVALTLANLAGADI
jgi:N-carbamoyl-L-amino-acid hydrolase